MSRFLSTLALTGALGCRDYDPPRPVDPGAWRVEAASPAVGAVAAPGTDGLPTPMRVDLDGPPGFVRATVTVERSPVDPGRRGELYDALFPNSGRLRLSAAVEPAAVGTGQVRVRLRAEGDAATSTTHVEPAVPLLAADAAVATEGLVATGRSIEGGREVEVGRWVATTPAGSARVTVRVLPSRAPTGPRLKGEGRPPR